MRIKVGTAKVSGRISNSLDKALAIELHARSNNAGPVYFGESDVGETKGREFMPGEAITLKFSDLSADGSVEMRFFFVKLVGGDKIDWTAILQ